MLYIVYVKKKIKRTHIILAKETEKSLKILLKVLNNNYQLSDLYAEYDSLVSVLKEITKEVRL